MSVECIRIGAVRLCLALMLGLLVVPAYVVAPVLFANLDSVVAGSLAGSIFHMAHVGLIFLLAAVAVFWLRMHRSGMQFGRMRWSLLALLALLVLLNEYGVAPVMADLKAQAGPMHALAQDDPDRQLFGLWHGISAVVHLLATLIAVALVALGASRLRCGNPEDTCPS